MPLVRIDVNEGRSEREFRAIGDAIHEALVTTCAVPADDRFQVFAVHSSQTLIYDESFMAMHRSDGIVLVQVIFNVGRTTEQTLRNLSNVLADAGVTREQVIKVNVYLADLTDWSALNGPYAEFFGSSLPARTAFATSALPLGARVEIEAWAVVEETR